MTRSTRSTARRSARISATHSTNSPPSPILPGNPNSVFIRTGELKKRSRLSRSISSIYSVPGTAGSIHSTMIPIVLSCFFSCQFERSDAIRRCRPSGGQCGGRNARANRSPRPRTPALRRLGGTPRIGRSRRTTLSGDVVRVKERSGPVTNPSRSSSAWALDLPAPFGPPRMMSCLVGTGR